MTFAQLCGKPTTKYLAFKHQSWIANETIRKRHKHAKDKRRLASPNCLIWTKVPYDGSQSHVYVTAVVNS